MGSHAARAARATQLLHTFRQRKHQEKIQAKPVVVKQAGGIQQVGIKSRKVDLMFSTTWRLRPGMA